MAETLNEVLEIVEATVNDKFEHLQDTNNPHNVTKEQVGLGSVDNTADIDKPVSNATSSAINTLRQEVFSAVTTLEQGTLSAVTTLRNDTFSAINTVQTSLTSVTERLENIPTTGIYDLSSLPKVTVTLDATTVTDNDTDIVAIFKMANTDELDTITTEGKYRLYLKMIAPDGENAVQIGYMTVTKTGIEIPQTETVSLQINQIVRIHPAVIYSNMTALETIPIAAYRYKSQDESGNFSNWFSWQNDELIDYLNFGGIPLPLSKVGQVKENGIIGADTTILIANGDGKEISKIPFDSIHRLAVSSTGQVSDIAFVQCFKADGTAVNIPVADFKAFIKS